MTWAQAFYGVGIAFAWVIGGCVWTVLVAAMLGVEWRRESTTAIHGGTRPESEAQSHVEGSESSKGTRA